MVVNVTGQLRTDASDRGGSEPDLEDARRKLLNNLPFGAGLMNIEDGRMLILNAQFSRIYGFDQKIRMGGLPAGANPRDLTTWDFIELGFFDDRFDKPKEYFTDLFERMKRGEDNRLVLEVGDRIIEILDRPIGDGLFVTTQVDITERVAAERQVEHLAHHDVLTGLLNRARLVERMEERLAEIGEDGPMMAVHFVDFDKFKEINDTHGHDSGDTVLRTIAERLQELTGEGDFVSRLGGDEFVAVQTNFTDAESAQQFAERIASSISQPIHLPDGQYITSTASIGVAVAPADGRKPERLLKSADIALYAAKGAGRDQVVRFDSEMDVQMQRRKQLEKRIRGAALDGDFVVHYQPILTMKSRDLIGFEALVRMPDENGELIPPDEFIPVAEELGLIGKVGEWVLHYACSAAANWPEHLKIAVNLSPAQFEGQKVSQVVALALSSSGLSADRLELEITERLLLGDSTEVVDDLHRLKEMGVSIVMDDFGTGYSSLSYLWQFDFDKIKIDRSFMKALTKTGRDSEQIVRTIMALGRELDMHVTVEGVENEDQVSFLDEAQADQVQGFYFGHPMPDSDVAAAILKDFKSAHAETEDEDSQSRKRSGTKS